MPRLSANRMAGNHQVDTGWCSGCGLHHFVTGEHRGDCTKFPPPCQHCLYYPAMNDGQHRADCPEAQDSS